MIVCFILYIVLCVMYIKKINDSLNSLVVNDDELGIIMSALSYASEHSLVSLNESKDFLDMLSILEDYVS